MDNLLQVFANNLLPVLLLAAAGYALGKFLPVDSRSVGRLTLYILSPILVFKVLTQSQLSPEAIARMLAFGVTCIGVMAALGYLAGRVLRLERSVLMAIVLTTMFGNSGNYGLPLIKFAFGDQALAYAGVYYVASSLMINTAGVIVASLGKTSIRKALLALFKVPAIYAIGLALLVVQMGWQLPEPLARTVDLAGDGAVPIMIILLGLELQRAEWQPSHTRALSTSVALRLLAAPFVALGLSILFGLQGPARQAGIIESSVPTAVLTTVLASEYDLEPSLVTAIVFVSTVLSPLTLTPLLVYLGG